MGSRTTQRSRQDSGKHFQYTPPRNVPFRDVAPCGVPGVQYSLIPPRLTPCKSLKTTPGMATWVGKRCGRASGTSTSR